MQYLLGLLAALIGAFYVVNTQKNKAEAGLQNLETEKKDLQFEAEQNKIESANQINKDSLVDLDKKEQNEKNSIANSDVADALNHWNKRS